MAIVTRNQPQGVARLDPANKAASRAVSVLVPAAQFVDLAQPSRSYVTKTGIVTSPTMLDFGATTSSLKVGFNSAVPDPNADFARLPTFTKILHFKLNSITDAREIYTIDARVTVGIGVESITPGQLGVSWYDGSFHQISFVPVAGTIYQLIVVGTTSGVSLYANGVLVGSLATGSILYNSGTGRGVCYGAFDFNSSLSALFSLYQTALLPYAFSQADVTEFYSNPWQLFAAPPRRLWLAASSGGAATAALSGLSATGSAGSIAPSITLAASGQSSTTSQGALTTAPTIGLSGQSITGTAGSVLASTTVATTGQSATSSPGSVSASQAGTAALTGQSATSSAGTLASQRTVGVTGQSATSQAGNLTLGIIVPLSGQTVTSAQGSVTGSTSGNRTAAITGQSLSVSQGIVIGPQNYPQEYYATIMRQTTTNVAGGTLKNSQAVQGGTMKASQPVATIMRASTTNTAATMRQTTINVIGTFL